MGSPVVAAATCCFRRMRRCERTKTSTATAATASVIARGRLNQVVVATPGTIAAAAGCVARTLPPSAPRTPGVVAGSIGRMPERIQGPLTAVGFKADGWAIAGALERLRADVDWGDS